MTPLQRLCARILELHASGKRVDNATALYALALELEGEG